jgi:hypothetical protein
MSEESDQWSDAKKVTPLLYCTSINVRHFAFPYKIILEFVDVPGGSCVGMTEIEDR